MRVGNNAMTFRRYRVIGKRPEVFEDAFLEAIRQNRFTELGDADEDAVAIGWITAENLFDTDFQQDKVHLNNYVVLCMRMDKRSVPSNLVAAYVQIEEKALLEDMGKEHLPPKKRKELKEEVRRRLLSERPPSSRVFQMHWNVNQQVLLFSSHNEAVNREFLSLFEDTFGLELDPVDPAGLTLLRLEEEGRPEAIYDIVPTDFTRGHAREVAPA